MISIGQGTVGPASFRLGSLVLPAGPGAVAFTNPGTSNAYLGLGGTGVSLVNGFVLPAGAITPLVIPLYAGSGGGTVYALTASGTTNVGWILSTSTAGTGL